MSNSIKRGGSGTRGTQRKTNSLSLAIQKQDADKRRAKEQLQRGPKSSSSVGQRAAPEEGPELPSASLQVPTGIASPDKSSGPRIVDHRSKSAGAMMHHRSDQGPRSARGNSSTRLAADAGSPGKARSTWSGTPSPVAARTVSASQSAADPDSAGKETVANGSTTPRVANGSTTPRAKPKKPSGRQATSQPTLQPWHPEDDDEDLAKKQRHVDAQRYGGHYHYIVSDLNQLEHDADRHAHDEAMAASMTHSARFGTSASPRYAPATSMSAAFTDRSARLREGVGAREALTSREPLQKEERGHGAPCPCAICRPQKMMPAGQPSVSCQTNQTKRVQRSLSGTLETPRPGEAASIFEGRAMAQTITSPLSHGSQQRPTQEEASFVASFGRKVKPSSPISPASARTMTHRGAGSEARAAGVPEAEAPQLSDTRSKRRQEWQGTVDNRPERKGVGLVLGHENQEPVFEKKFAEEVKSKAPGVFRPGESTAQAERHILNRNQQVFRFEGARGGGERSKSMPPDLDNAAGTARCPIPFDQRKLGGPNPVTMEGHCDMWRTNVGKKPCEQSASSRLRNRFGSEDITDHTFGDRCDAAHTAMRLQHDPVFAELCDHTGSQDLGQAAMHFKTSYGHKTSPGTKEAFAWRE